MKPRAGPAEAAFITGDPIYDDDRAFEPTAVPSYDPGSTEGCTGAMAWRHVRSVLADQGVRLATLDVLQRDRRDLRGVLATI
jgi:hypothetical protein